MLWNQMSIVGGGSDNVAAFAGINREGHLPFMKLRFYFEKLGGDAL